jgi:hypothetical protein
VKRGRKIIDIVENIKFIYTSFDEFFLLVSQIHSVYHFCSPQKNAKYIPLIEILLALILVDGRGTSTSKERHCVESYLYYIILVNKKKILRSETREKNNRHCRKYKIHIYEF